MKLTLIPLSALSRTVSLAALVATTWIAPYCPAKSVPAGIVNLCTGQITQQNTFGNLARHPWANPNVNGMRVKTQWQYVQPSSGAGYNWTGIDEAFRLATVNRKFIGLSVAAGLTVRLSGFTIPGPPNTSCATGPGPRCRCRGRMPS